MPRLIGQRSSVASFLPVLLALGILLAILEFFGIHLIPHLGRR